MELDLPSRQTSATAARPTLRSAPQTVPSKKRNAAQHPLHARKSPREWDTQSPLETTVLSAAESPRTPRLGSKLSPASRSLLPRTKRDRPAARDEEWPRRSGDSAPREEQSPSPLALGGAPLGFLGSCNQTTRPSPPAPG